MESLLQYLERAVQLEELAAQEPNQEFKSKLIKQAAAYRAMAAKRAAGQGLPPPSPPNISK